MSIEWTIKNISSIASTAVVLMIPADDTDEGSALTILRAAQNQIPQIPYASAHYPLQPDPPYRAGAGCGFAGGAAVLGFEKFTLGTSRAPSDAAK